MKSISITFNLTTRAVCGKPCSVSWIWGAKRCSQCHRSLEQILRCVFLMRTYASHLAHCTFAVPSTPLFLYIHSLTHIAPHPTLHRYIDGECTHKGAQGSGERYFGRAAYVGAQIYPQIITSRAPTQCKP